MAIDERDRKSKPWLCPKCSNQLGTVMFGQLYIDGDCVVNTDNSNLVVKCRKCGNRKIWFASDRLSQIIQEIADAVVRRQSQNRDQQI